jgi:hypothetical protein
MNYETEWGVERTVCDFLQVPSRNLPEEHEGNDKKSLSHDIWSQNQTQNL